MQFVIFKKLFYSDFPYIKKVKYKSKKIPCENMYYETTNYMQLRHKSNLQRRNMINMRHKMSL